MVLCCGTVNDGLHGMRPGALRRAPRGGELESDLPCADDDFDEHVRWATTAWPEIDPDVEGIVTRIDKAQRYLERAATDTLERVQLTHGELKVLLRLTRGTRGQGEVARNLLVSTGTMTNQLDKLEKAGLVRRHPDPDDRRGKIVEMTTKGHETLNHYISVQAKRERQLLSHLTPAEKQQLNDLLRKCLASLDDQSGPVLRKE
jgi:DNA-binding MarR family transcriptional regulator